MTDTILGNEISEFVANRQYAKIQYLQEENKQLQEQLRDMEKALKLNKEVLRLTLDQNSNINNSHNSTNSSEQIQSKQLMMKLHEENEMLRNQMLKLTEERNLAQNKVLLQQQISEENQAFYKDMIEELEDKLAEMRRCIQDKEYTIQDIEKNRGLIDNGQMIKIREIVTPNEQSLRLHEELESTRQILNKLSQESQHLQEQNHQLKEINQNFKRELIKVRIILRSPLAYYKMKNFIYNDEVDNSDENIGIHEEIYSNPGYAQEPIEQQPQQDILKQYGYQPPQQNMKYLTNNERAIYQEKLQKSESLLKGYKELFEKEKNKVFLLTQLTEDQEKKLSDSYSSNEQLINGIQLREQKIQQLQAEVHYYRTQYGNYMHLLKNKRKINMNLSFQLKEIQTQPPPPPPATTNILKDLEKEHDDAEQHISILDGINNFDDVSPDLKKGGDSEDYRKQNKRQSVALVGQQNQYQMNQQECRQFLLNTAKELYMEYNLKMNNLQKKQLMDPKKWGKPKPIWHVKSSSDPLDYFTLNFQNLQITGRAVKKFDKNIQGIRDAKFPQKKQPDGWDFINDFSMIQNFPHGKPQAQDSFTLDVLNDN